MAQPAYVESLTGSLPPEQRQVWKRVFDYVLGNLRFGPVVHQTRTENHQAYWLTGTTPAVALTPFSIAHGLGRVPYVAIPVLPLDAVNAQIVPLQVPRAADASRIYLQSTSTSAGVWLMVE